VTLRRRWFIARDRFHTWMWGGGPIRKAIIKRLPMHFADPHYLRAAEFERLMASNEATTLTLNRAWRIEPQSTLTSGQTFHLAQTWTGGNGSPVIYINGKRVDP
jgi:hypothetical protein